MQLTSLLWHPSCLLQTGTRTMVFKLTSIVLLRSILLRKRQTAVTAYLKRKQPLLFAFSREYQQDQSISLSYHACMYEDAIIKYLPTKKGRVKLLFIIIETSKTSKFIKSNIALKLAQYTSCKTSTLY